MKSNFFQRLLVSKSVATGQKEALAVRGAFGASVKRVEDPRFLMGQAHYVDDLNLPNTLSVAFVRSSYAHARIKSIDASKALKHPGVVRVMTGEEAKKLCKPIRVEFPEKDFPGKYKACDFMPSR